MAMSGRPNFWIPVICGGLILTIGIGARQSFGIFQKPIAADLNVGRELWSFGTALAMLLMGAFSPFVGNLADRFGTARTVAAGGMLYVAGMLMIALATEGVMLTVGNVLSGIGLAAAGFGPIFGAIARQTPPAQRSVASASPRRAARSDNSPSCRSPRFFRTASTTGIRPCSCSPRFPD
jgi:MFS family permease